MGFAGFVSPNVSFERLLNKCTFIFITIKMLVSVCLQGYLTSLSMKAFSYISLDGVVTGESRGASQEVHKQHPEGSSSQLWKCSADTYFEVYDEG